MSVEIHLHSDAFDGEKAELYYSTSLLFPVATTEISSGVATFDVKPREPYFLRAIQAGRTVLRIGRQSFRDGEISDNGFTAAYSVMDVADMVNAVIPIADLETIIPMPLTQDELVITRLALSEKDGKLLATGRGACDAGWFGNIPVNFSCEFRLEPVGAATSSRLVELNIINSRVSNAAGGSLGWRANIVGGLLLQLFKGDIEDSINDAIHSWLQGKLSGLDAIETGADQIMLTLTDIQTADAAVVLQPVACIPCAGTGRTASGKPYQAVKPDQQKAAALT